MDDDQQFCLRWNNHQSTLISVFDTLLENETLVDCTLAAEGKFLKAHKVVLSACSPYFATLLQEQYDKHPIFILKDVKYQELRAMMDYMYRGEVNISQDQLAALLKAAESLQIKGLSDNRSGGGASQPKHPEHHRATMPGKLSGGYTLEQTKRARITGAAGPAMDASEMGSREGSSSPSRRRRKVRRRSIENPMTDVHDNSNSSQQPTQSNAPGLGAITAAASALAAAAAGAPSSAAAAAALASTVVPLSATQQQHQSSTSAVTPAATGTTLSSSKKTDNVKGSTQQHQQQQQDAINTDNVQGSAAGSLATGTPAMDTETATDASTADKSNHKQQLQQQQKGSASKDTSSVTGSELVIEPKAEYDDEANDETVEDLTLDEEDMGMDDLDHNAGTSQGGEGSSQGYAPWQHDRSQDELLLATQEAQQRDPQDIYPILGSLLGVDTNNSNEQSPNNSNNDLFQNYGYLNNNITIHATGRGGGGGGTANPGGTASEGNSNANNLNSNPNGGAAAAAALAGLNASGSILINALSGGGGGASNLMERDDYMQCKHCKRFYKSVQKLQEHVRKYCLKEKKYKCVSCEYRSRRKDHVLRHAKRKHCDLYEQYRDDEDALFVIRTEDDGDDQMGGRYDTDVDYDATMEDYLVPSVTMGIGSGSVLSGNGGGSGGGGNNMDTSMGFKFGCRDLTITAVPIMQESDDDDDDYDEDD